MNEQDRENIYDFERLRRLAASIDSPVDLRRVQAYSAYLQGARAALLKFVECFSPMIFKGKEAAYNKAVVRLATSTLRNTDLFLSGEHEIRFRDFRSDRKGKCVECEAYFARQVTMTEEVK